MNTRPKNLKIQTVGLEQHAGIVKKGPTQLLEYFRTHPDEVQRVLGQSSDKRGSPSTFVEEQGSKIVVGWFDSKPEFVREFDNLEEAVTDYVLFSFGMERII